MAKGDQIPCLNYFGHFKSRNWWVWLQNEANCVHTRWSSQDKRWITSWMYTKQNWMYTESLKNVFNFRIQQTFEFKIWALFCGKYTTGFCKHRWNDKMKMTISKHLILICYVHTNIRQHKMIFKVLHISISSTHMWNKHWEIILSDIDLHFNNYNIVTHYKFLLLGTIYRKTIEFT